MVSNSFVVAKIFNVESWRTHWLKGSILESGPRTGSPNDHRCIVAKFLGPGFIDKFSSLGKFWSSFTDWLSLKSRCVCLLAGPLVSIEPTELLSYPYFDLRAIFALNVA